MKIIFTEHAKQRIKERKIEEKDVIYTLFAPDKYQPTYHDRICVSKKIGNKTLEIIYTEEKEKMIVITCYYL